MNPSKAWIAKLEAASFMPSKILYRQCDLPLWRGLRYKYRQNKKFYKSLYL